MTSKMLKFLTQHKLAMIIVVGILLRVIYALKTSHIYYADELYQVLEPGFNKAYGYGLVAWDFRQGIRSLVPPTFISIILSTLKTLNITDPILYIPVIKIIFSMLSSIIILASYQITRSLTKNIPLALISAFVAAFWYEYIYFASSTLLDLIGIYFLLAGISIILRSTQKKSQIISGCLFAMSIYLRYPLIILLPLVTHLFLKIHKISMKKALQLIKPLIISSMITILILSLYDQITLGIFGGSMVNHIKSNISPLSQVFGTQPWWYYIIGIFFSTSGLIVFLKYLPKKYHYILYHIAAIIIFFSLLPHKEYRFILPTIPFILILITVSINSLLKQQKYIIFIFVAASILAITTTPKISQIFSIPYSSYPYQQQFFKTDSLLKYYSTKLHNDQSICGIFDATRPWMNTGGYYYLSRDIPVYDTIFRPYQAEYVNVIITSSIHDQIEGYELVDSFPYQDEVGATTMAVFKRNSICQTDPDYSYNRTIPEVEDYLKAINVNQD